MKRFLLGFAAGALGAYVATKLIDKETREEWFDELEDTADKVRGKFEDGVRCGRGRAMRAGVRVRQEYREGRRKVNETAGDLAEKIAENLNEFGEKAKERANS